MTQLSETDREIARLARTGDLTMNNIGRHLGLTYNNVKYSLQKQGISIREIKASAGISNPWPTLGPQLLDNFRKDLRAMGFAPANRLDDIIP